MKLKILLTVILKTTLISANFNFLRTHLKSAFKTLNINSSPDGEIQPTEFPISTKNCFKCGVNKSDRKQCRKHRPNLSVWKCKKFGCCYNAEDKMCYRPSKKECPLAKCEAVQLKKRELVRSEIPGTCPAGFCFDRKRDQCFQKDEPVCPKLLKKNVEYKRCGWKKIKKNFCELEEGCCWNKRKRFCHYGAENEMNAPWTESAEITNLTTEAPEILTEPVFFRKPTSKPAQKPIQTTSKFENLPNMVKNLTNEVLEANIQIPEQVKNELDQLLKLEEVELTSEDGEHSIDSNDFVPDGEHFRTSFSDILNAKDTFSKIRQESIGIAVSQCSKYGENFAENRAAVLNCQRMMFKKHQHALAIELCSEKMTREQKILRCIQDFDNEFPVSGLTFPVENRENQKNRENQENQEFTKFRKNRPPLLTPITGSSQPPNLVKPPTKPSLPRNKNIGFNQIIAQREAERRCEEKYVLEKSKDFKRCVIFTMPSILRDLTDNPIFQRPKPSVDDQAMERMLRNACFSKMEEFDLCKVLALSGRPLASLKKEQLDPLQSLIKAEMSTEDLIPIMFTDGFTLQDGGLLTKLAEVRSRKSLEEDILTKLVTGFSDDIATGLTVALNAPTGPASDCLKTLFLNVIDPGFKRMSYFTSSARKLSSKTECENAGFCWTEYSIDTIVQEAFGGRSKENYKSLFMFTPQIDRILGDDDLSLFDSKCVKKASDNYVNMVRFEQLRS